MEDEYLIALELGNRLRATRVLKSLASRPRPVRRCPSQPQATPALAIMDIRLADRTDGIQAAVELYAAFGVRSIFASAHADPETRKRATAASPIGWLQKPYPQFLNE
ncbi:response regulator [Rhizobium laguerreae]|uniref:response regulator n=1 Tax=Rhizobium leguminosarum TaxID=384 RepID=UPI001C93DA25|nr:response regulator [Rhizobium leguminosarum]MBY5773251.1 response regulator [Rhizobium leguminosarum]